MLKNVRRINEWFRTATRDDVDYLLSKIILTERQNQIFELFYLKKETIIFISDKLCISPSVVSEELYLIRDKISVVIF